MIAVKEAGVRTAIESERSAAKIDVGLIPIVAGVALGEDLAVGAVDVISGDGASSFSYALACGVVDIEAGAARVDRLDAVFGVVEIVVHAIPEEVASGVVRTGDNLVF